MNGESLAIAMQHDPKDPGKFEGEDRATVYFYNCDLGGTADEVLSFIAPTESVYRVDDEERTALDLTEPYYALHYREDGFVVGSEVSAKEFARLEALAESESEQDCA